MRWLLHICIYNLCGVCILTVTYCTLMRSQQYCGWIRKVNSRGSLSISFLHLLSIPPSLTLPSSLSNFRHLHLPLFPSSSSFFFLLFLSIALFFFSTSTLSSSFLLFLYLPLLFPSSFPSSSSSSPPLPPSPLPQAKLGTVTASIG